MIAKIAGIAKTERKRVTNSSILAVLQACFHVLG